MPCRIEVIKHPVLKALIDRYGQFLGTKMFLSNPNMSLEEANKAEDIKDKESVLLSGTSQENVKYVLKSVNILLSDKANQIFEKGKKANWSIDRILQELQIPKEQKQIIIDSYNELSNINNKINIQNLIDSGEITYTDEENNPCAAKGLTNTTKGTNWKIVKDFKGQPKHSQGGVDITISDKSVTMRRGGKDIKAKHGLLIPNNN